MISKTAKNNIGSTDTCSTLHFRLSRSGCLYPRGVGQQDEVGPSVAFEIAPDPSHISVQYQGPSTFYTGSSGEESLRAPLR